MCDLRQTASGCWGSALGSEPGSYLSLDFTQPLEMLPKSGVDEMLTVSDLHSYLSVINSVLKIKDSHSPIISYMVYVSSFATFSKAKPSLGAADIKCLASI